MIIKNLNEVSRHEDLVMRKLEENYYLMVGADVYEANEVGATIVNAIGRDLLVEELCVKISQKYDFNDIEQIRNDVSSYMDFLINKGLLIYG